MPLASSPDDLPWRPLAHRLRQRRPAAQLFRDPPLRPNAFQERRYLGGRRSLQRHAPCSGQSHGDGHPSNTGRMTRPAPRTPNVRFASARWGASSTTSKGGLRPGLHDQHVATEAIDGLAAVVVMQSMGAAPPPKSAKHGTSRARCLLVDRQGSLTTLRLGDGPEVRRKATAAHRPESSATNGACLLAGSSKSPARARPILFALPRPIVERGHAARRPVS
jgi:hypothetical protein